MTTRLPVRKSSRLKDYDYLQAGFYFITICTQNRIDRFGKIQNGKMILNDAGKMVQSVWTNLPLRFRSITLDAFQIMPNHIHGIIQIITPVRTPLVGVRNATNGTNNSFSEINTDTSIDLQNSTNTHTISNMLDSEMQHSTINGDDLLIDATFARNTKIDVAVDVADDKTGVCFGSGRGRTGTRPVPTVTAGGDNPCENLGCIVGAFKSIITHRYCNGVKMGLVPPFNKRLFQHRYHDHIIRNENVLFRIRQYIQNNPLNWCNDKMNALNNNKVQEIVTNYEEESWMV